MKKAVSILSLAILVACNSSSKEENKEIQAAANDKAAEMTNGATNAPVAEAAEGHKKYDIKSGIITYETKMEMMGTVMKSKKILYFDDYGIKECEEEYKADENGKEVLDKRDFVKNGDRYVCNPAYNNGSKSKAMGYGVAAPFNLDEASTMKDNNFKKLGDETVCGKPCNGFSMVTPSGTIKMWGWNKITLKTTLDEPSMKIKSETIATKIQENVAIPADKFEVPTGVVLQNM